MQSLISRTIASIILLGAIPLMPEALAAGIPDFDRDVKPVLERRCFDCHGPEKQKGGLRLDVKPAVLKGGDSGEPAVVPGDRLKSHLLKLVSSNDPDDRMPPKGERLGVDEIVLLQRWVETGAHWSDTSAAPDPAAIVEVLPERMITEKDRQFWSFVPPRAAEPSTTAKGPWARTSIDQFILSKLESRELQPSSDAPRATLIRRLAFDLTGLPPTPDEVEAFISDSTPGAYERIVDRLLSSPAFGERMASLWLPLARYAEDQAHQVAKDTKLFYPNAWKYRQWVIDAFNRDLPYDRFLFFQLAADQTDEAKPEDFAALGFLGLGPKYYSRNRLDVMADEWEDRVDTVTRTMLGLTVACARCHDHKFDPISTRDYYALAGVFASTQMVNRLPDGTVQKGELDAAKVDSTAVHAVADDQPKDLNVFIRGNVERKGPVVARRFLSVLSAGEPVSFKDGSGRRELALAIVDGKNPLTARVMVNRVWGIFFGRPLVSTPSNFGHSGQPPSHPELLDDLAVRFMRDGWSVKSLVRQVVLSSTYRQDSRDNALGIEVDPSNELLWRMNRRRLPIEQWRDQVLFVSGQLTSSDGKSMELSEPANCQRTVFAHISRKKLDDLLLQFDYPDANVHAERRSVTTTPMQKLFMMNSAFMLAQAKAFAARLAAETPEGDEPRVRRAYQLLFAREPDPEEMSLALDFLHQPQRETTSRWEQYSQLLLASNEALYVD